MSARARFDSPEAVGERDPAPGLPSSLGGRRLPRLLHPLRRRDFGLLWAGLTVSLVGDGVYVVAIAWQVYDLSGTPAALATVGAAWTLPQVLLLALGGVVSDRRDRRRVMIAADLVRGAAVAAIGVLSLSGALALGHVIALVVLVGVGDALFLPAVTAIVPTLVPGEELVQANAIERLVQPLCMRFIGPAAGGALIAGLGAGWALLIDAGTFGCSAVAISLMAARPARRRAGGTLREELGEGWRFVRSHAWLWATLCSAAIALLAFFGPVQVLVPYLVKHRLHEGPETFGAVLAAGGLGSIAVSIALAQRGLPRRHVTFMYVVWALSGLAVAGYALADRSWQFMAVAAVAGGGAAAGMLVWATLMQRLVPNELLGRVSSLDWLVSIGLVPVSYALTGPVNEVLGPTTTLVVAGVVSAVVPCCFLLVPGVRDPERAPAGRA